MSALGRVVRLRMLAVSATDIMVAFAQIERIAALTGQWEDPTPASPDTEVLRKVRKHVASHYTAIRDAAHAMGAPVTRAAASRAVTRLNGRENLTFRELRVINNEIGSRLEDEILSLNFYCMPKMSSEYYNPAEPLFGASVANRIPEASDDVSEAGKCFAVGRYTASAFHLMRAMEVAVKVLSSELGIENVEREWGKLLSDIAKAIEPMRKGEKRDEWSAVHANLYHVKQAWRNKTMHPKRTYTEEEAREVFDAMKAFMRQLASLLPVSAEEMIG